GHLHEREKCPPLHDLKILHASRLLSHSYIFGDKPLPTYTEFVSFKSGLAVGGRKFLTISPSPHAHRMGLDRCSTSRSGNRRYRRTPATSRAYALPPAPHCT